MNTKPSQIPGFLKKSTIVSTKELMPSATLVGVAEAWPSETAGASDVSSQVVPGATVEPVHAVPDASEPRSLHRPLHIGAAPPE